MFSVRLDDFKKASVVKVQRPMLDIDLETFCDQVIKSGLKDASKPYSEEGVTRFYGRLESFNKKAPIEIPAFGCSDIAIVGDTRLYLSTDKSTLVALKRVDKQWYCEITQSSINPIITYQLFDFYKSTARHDFEVALVSQSS